MLQLLVSFSGFCVFLYFYLRKSLVAWYVLVTTFYLMMPFFFVVLQKPVSDVPTVAMVLVLGTVFFIVIKKTYGPYRDYVNEFHSDAIGDERVGTTTVTNMPSLANDDHFLTKTEDKSLNRGEKTLAQSTYISFRCSCGQKIKVGIENAGKTGKCPKCQHRVTVPDK